MAVVSSVASHFSVKKMALGFTTGVLCIIATIAQADTLLRYKFTPGEKLTYEFNQEMTSHTIFNGRVTSTVIKGKIIFLREVKKVDANGNATVAVTVIHAERTAVLPSGQILKYDPSRKKASSGKSTSILDKKVEKTIDTAGYCKDEKLPEKLSNQPFLGAHLGNSDMEQIILGIALPRKAVAAGKTWSISIPGNMPKNGKSVYKRTYKYIGTEKGNADLEKIVVEGKTLPVNNTSPREDEIEQQGKAEIFFDNKLGRMQRFKSTTKFVSDSAVNGTVMTDSRETTNEIKLVPNSKAK